MIALVEVCPPVDPLAVASMIDWANGNAAGGAKCWPLADSDGFTTSYLFGFDRDDDATLFRLRFGIGGKA